MFFICFYIILIPIPCCHKVYIHVHAGIRMGSNYLLHKALIHHKHYSTSFLSLPVFGLSLSSTNSFSFIKSITIMLNKLGQNLLLFWHYELNLNWCTICCIGYHYFCILTEGWCQVATRFQVEHCAWAYRNMTFCLVEHPVLLFDLVF